MQHAVPNGYNAISVELISTAGLYRSCHSSVLTAAASEPLMSVMVKTIVETCLMNRTVEVLLPYYDPWVSRCPVKRLKG